MWTLLLLPAFAGGLGAPIPDPAAARVQLALTGQTEDVAARVQGCEDDEGCDMSLLQRRLGAELSVAVLRGLGVYANYGRVNSSVEGAAFSGSGRAWTLGARGALPVYKGLGLAADVHIGSGTTEGAARGDQDLAPGDATVTERGARLLATVGAPSGGGMLWAGAELQWGWSMDLNAPADEATGLSTAYAVEAERPLSGVLGGSLHSEPIGLPWRLSPRLSAGAELSVGQIRSVGAWIGLGL